MKIIYEVLFNIVKYAALSIIAGLAGILTLAVTVISAVAAPFSVVSNLTSLVKADPDTVERATSDHRGSVALITLLATCIPALAASFVTRPEVTTLLLLPSLVGLGVVGIRAFEFAGSGFNQYSNTDKTVGNISACVIAVVAASLLAPVLNPHIFVTAALTGVLITIVSRLRNAPKQVSLPIAIALGAASAYATGGLLGAGIVSFAAVIHVNAITTAVNDLNNAGDNENKQIRAKGDYAVSFTLLKTTIVAAVLVLINSLF
jgi:hypothetical protein